MDLRTLVAISALLLVTAGSKELGTNNCTQSPNTTNTTNINSPTASNCSCPSPPPAHTPQTNSGPTVLGLLIITWTEKHAGILHLHLPSSSLLHVCYNSSIYIKKILKNLTEKNKVCKDTLQTIKGGQNGSGYEITESGVSNKTSCEPLMFSCPVVTDTKLQRQLHSYKVVTALLCCVLLIVLLLRFTRPTVKALQKRLSDRRQNRWIGPTQSHSVSYHRGKTVVKNNDGEKRLSYPALERLAVSDSREPSSNRNSDCNF